MGSDTVEEFCWKLPADTCKGGETQLVQFGRLPGITWKCFIRFSENQALSLLSYHQSIPAGSLHASLVSPDLTPFHVAELT